MYAKDSQGSYINLDRVDVIHATEVPPSSGTWVIKASNWEDERWILSGTWTSKSDAQEAIRELIDGVDPATYGD